MSYTWPTITADVKGVRPIRDEVFIRVEELDERPLAPGSKMKRANHDAIFSASDRGYVEAVGPGRELEDGTLYMPLNPGDYVVFNWKKGDDYQYQGKHYIMLRLENIYGTLESVEI